MSIPHISAAIKSTMGPPSHLNKTKKETRASVVLLPSPLAPELGTSFSLGSLGVDPFLGSPAQEVVGFPVCAWNQTLSGTPTGRSWDEC